MKINKIYNENCLETMERMPDNFLDLTVTSPPYDNLRKYNGYSFDFENTAKELYRVTKKGGIVVWIVNDATIKGSESGTSFRQVLYFKEIGFNIHDTMIWNKTKMPQNHNRYEQGFEYMFILSKGKPKTFNGIRDKKNIHAGVPARAGFRDKDGQVKRTKSFNKTKIADYGLRTNVWKNNGCYRKIDRNGHPAPFPEQLINDHIISWGKPFDLVYDPFMGSGTTAKMAILNKRNFIGSEISIEYCNIIKTRIIKTINKKLTDLTEGIEYIESFVNRLERLENKIDDLEKKLRNSHV